jgi:hypothetical protein
MVVVPDLFVWSSQLVVPLSQVVNGSKHVACRPRKSSRVMVAEQLFLADLAGIQGQGIFLRHGWMINAAGFFCPL